MTEPYAPGMYYTMGWNDRYSGKDNSALSKRGIWSETLIEEYNQGYAECSKKIVGEVRESMNKSTMNETRQFIQE